MEYDNVSTEELLTIASETNTINPESTPHIIADYQNGKIVQQIVSIMSEMGLTQKDLAKRIGTSKQYVSRILNEKQNFTISSLAVFSTALQCDLSITLVQRKRGEIDHQN